MGPSLAPSLSRAQRSCLMMHYWRCLRICTYCKCYLPPLNAFVEVSEHRLPHGDRDTEGKAMTSSITS